MPSFFQKTMLYLGLAPEEEYDDLEHVDPYTDPQSGASERRPQPPQRQQEYAPQAVSHQPKHQTAPPPSHSEAEPGAVRTISREQAVAAGGKVSPIAASPPPLPSASVRTFAMSSVKPHVVAPRQFNDCSLPHQPSSSLGETMSRAQNSTASLKCSARKLTANSSCRSSNAATGRGPTCLPPTAWVVSLVPANSPPELAQGPWPPTMTTSTRGVHSPLLETVARAAGMNSRRALTTRSRQPLLVSARVATGSAITTATA